MRGARCQFELEEICIEWDMLCYRSQLTHASAADPACVRMRYKWLAGQPVAMNITEHSQLKFKLTGGTFPQSTFSFLCGGGICAFFPLAYFISSLYISHSIFLCQ